jgi:molecular chaperone GrpE
LVKNMSSTDDKQQNIEDVSDDMKPHDDPIADSSEVMALQTKIEELTNNWKRAVADYQNLEKRHAENRSELTAWATTNMLQRLLPVLNHFEVALDNAGKEERGSGWFKGVEMATKELKAVLRDEGLEEIRADGQQFDPALHEAIDTDEGQTDKVLRVAEKGYTLHGKVIKAAKVVVGKKKG